MAAWPRVTLGQTAAWVRSAWAQSAVPRAVAPELRAAKCRAGCRNGRPGATVRPARLSMASMRRAAGHCRAVRAQGPPADRNGPGARPAARAAGRVRRVLDAHPDRPEAARRAAARRKAAWRLAPKGPREAAWQPAREASGVAVAAQAGQRAARLPAGPRAERAASSRPAVWPAAHPWRVAAAAAHPSPVRPLLRPPPAPVRTGACHRWQRQRAGRSTPAKQRWSPAGSCGNWSFGLASRVRFRRDAPALKGRRTAAIWQPALPEGGLFFVHAAEIAAYSAWVQARLGALAGTGDE